ncbi:lysylphosphatidylglycerol synthase domain-containing protein [Zavarzinia sp. CC-PAN008]|uniref:lysylphosphatidylglycerol synthase domain-containing protein n=1 Tax=Zavarzinia sp. CC-PAN008 TaxID=3243332 RepID=UPI003F7491A0
MRLAAILFAILGVAAATLLLAHYGAGDVLAVVASLGLAGLAIVTAVRLALVGVMGIAWWCLFPHAAQVRPATGVWARLVRDAVADVLPFSQVGGFVAGARALVLRGVPGGLAAASTLVDVTTEVAAQILYIMIGLVLFQMLRPDTDWIVPALVALAVMALAIGIFIQIQRRGAAGIGRRLANAERRWFKAFGNVEAAMTALRQIHHRPGRIAASTVLHLVAWLGTTLESWVALQLMGVDIPVMALLAIEAMLYAVRSAAFLVPNALGVQEGAYIALGGMLGLDPQSALALSLVKRARDILIGVPALLAWQAVEGRRAWRRSAPQAGSDPGRG